MSVASPFYRRLLPAVFFVRFDLSSTPAVFFISVRNRLCSGLRRFSSGFFLHGAALKKKHRIQRRL